MKIVLTAIGSFTVASEQFSTAMGNSTDAQGVPLPPQWVNLLKPRTIVYSEPQWVTTDAPSFAETVIGSYNTTYHLLNLFGDILDRLFVGGNGTILLKRNGSNGS